jgi:hypothetical protein
MAQKPTQKKTYKVDDPMSKGAFQSFIRHFPNYWLREAGKILGDGHKSIDRVAFYAIAHGLVEVGDFKTGENFRLSQIAIADITGTSPKTVRRVLALLEWAEAIRVVELSRRPGGGTPVKNYQLVYSSRVDLALKAADRNAHRDRWKREPRQKSSDDPAVGNTTPVQEVTQPHPVGNTTPPSREHNPTKGMFKNVQAASEAVAPSLSTSSLNASHRDESSEEKKSNRLDEYIADAMATANGDLADLLAGL